MCKGALDSDESVSESIESICQLNVSNNSNGGEIRAQLGLRYEDVTNHQLVQLQLHYMGFGDYGYNGKVYSSEVTKIKYDRLCSSSIC